MEKEQLAFARMLEQLKDTARLQGNMLTKDQIDEGFADMKLSEEQMQLIYEYLNKNKIGVDEPLETSEVLTREEVNFLQMYLDELDELEELTDGEKRVVYMTAIAGDTQAQNKLTEIFLKNVVEIAKLYAGQGALLEDLIGEGNVALTLGAGMVGCLETPDEVEGFLGKMIMDAMEQYTTENVEEKEAGMNAAEKTNLVAEKARELADDLQRKATVEEVARELNLDEDEVRSIVQVSANHIDDIDMGTAE